MKRLKLMICAAALSMTAFAQTNNTEASKTEKYTVQTNLFKDNWFIGANVGGQYYIGDGRKLSSRKKLLSPVFEVNVGKWFTPGIGLRLGFDGYQAKGYLKEGNSVYKHKWGVLDLHTDVMLNLTNMFCGYKEDRLYNFIPYASIGYARNTKSHDNELSWGAGLINRFRINNSWAANLEVRSLAYNDVFDGKVAGKNYEATIAVMAGVTYNLGKKNWTKGSGVSIAELEDVQAKLREMNEENERLNRESAALNQDLQQKDQELQQAKADQNDNLTDAMTYTVFFDINRAYLSNKEVVNLNSYANLIKNNPNNKFIITGYADKQTGRAEYNDKLSQERAESVYNTLVDKYGVNPSQLTVEHKGGVDTMFENDSKLSRAAIIEMVK